MIAGKPEMTREQQEAIRRRILEAVSRARKRSFLEGIYLAAVDALERERLGCR